MSEQVKAKAVWTIVKPGYEVSEKGCFKVGRSMIMPKDIQLLLDLPDTELRDMLKFALEQNKAVKAIKEKNAFGEKLMATVGKLDGDKAQVTQALEEFLARLKNS